MGGIKRYHATLWQQVRIVGEAVKDNYGGFDIKACNGLTTWLLKHTTWICSRDLLQSDGQISYGRRWGRTYHR